MLKGALEYITKATPLTIMSNELALALNTQNICIVPKRTPNYDYALSAPTWLKACGILCSLNLKIYNTIVSGDSFPHFLFESLWRTQINQVILADRPKQVLKDVREFYNHEAEMIALEERLPNQTE